MNDESTPKGAPEAVAGETHSTSYVDEFGLPPLCCFRSHLDGRSIGYAEGYATGRADHADESWSLACKVVNGAAKSVDILAARRKADQRMREVAR